MDRRSFTKTLISLVPVLETPAVAHILGAETSPAASAQPAGEARATFPPDSYTPFGYLDNPFHYWDLNPSGVLRSLPPVGFGLYYPAGPGGYFDYHRNSIYRVFLRIGIRIHGRVLIDEADFHDAAISIDASYHSKNVLAYRFSVSPLVVTAPFFLVGEDTLACNLRIVNSSAQPQKLEVIAVERLELGDSDWWGRDGIAGFYDEPDDALVLRTFAAGPVFALKSRTPSVGRIITQDDQRLRDWCQSALSPPAQPVNSYFPHPLNAALMTGIEVPANGSAEALISLSRAKDVRRAQIEVKDSPERAASAWQTKLAEDNSFWTRAPQLDGDFPEYWRRSWIYDFETLRMMVRQPKGVYRHPWDAMQIQAPRNVLAETSIDMWTLAYADSTTAQAVMLGQFLDALDPNVPCMREDGVMNMVAVDGSACGTALQWCYPFYCMESVYLRHADRQWLSQLYPCLALHLDWMLKNRTDHAGWIVAKCSWESGMDGSQRFLVEQPTGGELTEFVRVPELQAAMCHAARTMKLYAGCLGEVADIARWDSVVQTYAHKTQQLWFDGWFYDQDACSGKPIVIPGHREVTQTGPVMCGVATADQIRDMLPKLRDYEHNQEFWLEWPSHVLPYAESLWVARDREFLSRLLYGIVERVYKSMDRRQVEPASKLGWPGVSCEMWGLAGSRGGEGYGWGATLPAHIIRSLFGFREGADPAKTWFTLTPNIPEALWQQGSVFGLRNLHYRESVFDLDYRKQGARTARVTLQFQQNAPRSLRVRDESGVHVGTSAHDHKWSFVAKVRHTYRVEAAS